MKRLKTVVVTLDVFQVLAVLIAIILASVGEVSWWIPFLLLLWGLQWEVTFRFTRGGKHV